MAKLPNPEFPMKDKYEVGYGKPPKASRFGIRPQPDRSSKSDGTKASTIGIAATLNGSMKITHNGTVVRVPPHEAMMQGLANSGLRGNIRAMKVFLLECKKAGMLEAPPAPQTAGVLMAPVGISVQLTARLVSIAGPPPWHEELVEECKSEYERERENIQKLLEEEKVRRHERRK
jgi:hypothetical protein